MRYFIRPTIITTMNKLKKIRKTIVTGLAPTLLLLMATIGFSLLFGTTGVRAAEPACGTLTGSDLTACEAAVRQCRTDHAGSPGEEERCIYNVGIFTGGIRGGGGGEASEDASPPNTGTTTTGSPELDDWLQRVVDLLSLAVGLVIVISIIIAGIQYITAGGNAGQVAAAKNRISMAVLAFILFGFTYALLQWLIPGGVFN